MLTIDLFSRSTRLSACVCLGEKEIFKNEFGIFWNSGGIWDFAQLNMSKTTKKKYVEKEILDNFELPTEEQEIVKVKRSRYFSCRPVLISILIAFQVMESRGNNLHEVQDASGEKYLVSMPPKYRNNIWIKRGISFMFLEMWMTLIELFSISTNSGNFVVVEQIEEGDKVKAEIVNILMSDQIKYYKKQGKW